MPAPEVTLTVFGGPPHARDIVVRASAERWRTTIRARWFVSGRLDRLALPSETGPRVRRDRLWEHTCVEAFLAPVTGTAYWELNVAPTGDWNLYRFEGPRTGMTPERRFHGLTAFTAAGDDSRFALTATLDVAPIPALADGPLAVALAAVLETRSGERSYWALTHPGAAPDFHRRDSFLLRL